MTYRKKTIMFVGISLLITGLSIWGYKLYVLSTSVKDYAEFWKEEQKQPGELTYLALGDSAAQGIGASHPMKGYVGLIADSLAKTTGKSVRIVNVSQSGATTKEVIESQLPQLKKYQADFVTIDIGGNDLKSYDRANFEKNIDLVTSALPPGTYIADTPYFMHGKWERNANEAQQIIKTYAKKNDLVIAPLHDTMRRGGWQAMFTTYAADWFHPNDRGYEAWYKAFWTKIKTVSDSSITRND